MKILIVDDSSDDRLLLRCMIEKHGHQAVEAEDGFKGLWMAKSTAPDLIISDGLMPRIDGFQLLRSIKQVPELYATPFVFYSASYKEEQDIRLAISLGAEAYIIKPVEPIELWEQIERIIEKGKEKKESPARQPPQLLEEDVEYLRRYSEVVAAKLEEKVRELERTLEDRKLAEERIRQLAQRLEAICEEERKRLARELHDDIGQTLTALKIDLVMIKNECTCTGPMAQKIEDMQKLLSEGIQSVHSLCRQLRPGALDDLGLAEALEGLISDWMQRNSGVNCTLNADVNADALSDGAKTTVFRFVQEALTNVSRYAAASNVDINLVAAEQFLSLSVADNGCGMEPGAADKPTSFGLLGMRERLESLGGNLHIESSLGKGTRIEGTIPLRRTESA